MATILYESDADLSVVQGRQVAVIGYGSQGEAHALNLRDSGVDIRVGLRPESTSWQKAEEQGLRVLPAAEAAAEADVVVMLIPDTHQKALWEGELSRVVDDRQALIFAHGFNIHYDLIQPPSNIDIILVAPKSPGHIVRRMYEVGNGVPGLIGVHQNATGEAGSLAKSYAAGIGLTRAGVLETTFAEETETDLFGEQAVLCGGLSHLVMAGFEILVEAGYQPEAAYFECLHELKLIVDLMYEGGVSWMRHSVSTTAEYGDYVTGPRIVTDATRSAMRDILTEVQDGTFARNFIAEIESGGETFAKMRKEGRNHEIERVGRELRAMMPFIDTPPDPE